jgi:hypothetical protein
MFWLMLAEEHKWFSESRMCIVDQVSESRLHKLPGGF